MKKIREIATGTVLFLAFVLLCLSFISRISNTESTGEFQLVREAVKNAAVTCYAVEGAYPSNLEYLRDHYGLAYDDDRYIVAYHAFSSNILPEIQVLERGVDRP